MFKNFFQNGLLAALGLVLVLLLSGQLLRAVETQDEVYILDYDNSATGYQAIQFGSGASVRYLKFDRSANEFSMDDDLSLSGKIKTSELENSGSITIDANYAATNSTVFIKNEDVTKVADLNVEGEITVGGTQTKTLTLPIDIGASLDTVQTHSGSFYLALDPDQVTYQQWVTSVPDDWVVGTDIDVEICSIADLDDLSQTGDVVWQIEYSSIGAGDAYPWNYGTDTYTQTYAADNNTLQSTATNLTIPSSEISVDESLVLILSRIGSDVDDTYPGLPRLHVVRLMYEGKKLL